MSKDYVLEMIDITKEFPGVKALDGVQLKVKKGTVHALMGENGAGKSTLMKILIGIYPPDKGKNQDQIHLSSLAYHFLLRMNNQRLHLLPGSC